MLKPIRWNTFLRDFIVIQAGFALFGISIASTIRSNLGTATWSVLEVALANILHISIGTVSVGVGFLAFAVALVLREQVGWGTLANTLSIGPWLDLTLRFMPSIEDDLPIQVSVLLIGILLQGLATAIYIGVNAGAGPRDSVMLAIHRTTGVSIRFARAAIEVSVCLLGWILGGPIGFGTVLFALLVGPAVQWGFKLFKLQPHNIVEPSPVGVGAGDD